MSDSVVRLTRAQVREVDRRAIEEYGVPGIVLMENAARGAAEVAWEMVRGEQAPVVTIVCGPGNNGGDGMAMARHLHNRGANVLLVFTAFDPTKYKGEARINWDIARAMNIPLQYWEEFQMGEGSADLFIDALFGTGLKEPPREDAEHLIELMNQSGCPILAVDIPSGLDCDTGEPLGVCARAARTVTFVAEKVGFGNPASKQYTGEVVVADIGCPREIIEEIRRGGHG